MKTLSIAVPTYNVEKYLNRCIDSLIYDVSILKDIEIIIVNDGSKDNSLNIAKEYEKKYPETIIVIDKENGGHGSTINEALKISTGKYFRVLDSDDWFNIDEFSTFVKKLKSQDEDIILTNYSRELIYSSEQIKFTYPKEVEYNKTYNLKTFDFSKLKLDYFFMATSTIKTNILKDMNLNLDEKTFYVDMEYVVLPINKLNTMIYLDYDIYRYYIGRPDQSISLKGYINHRKDHEKVLKRLINYFNTEKLSPNKKEYVKKILILTLNSHYIIYCKTKEKNNIMKKEIKEFDSYLKKANEDLYNLVGEQYKYIDWNRKTNFVFSQTLNNIISRIAGVVERREKR